MVGFMSSVSKWVWEKRQGIWNFFTIPFFLVTIMLVIVKGGKLSWDIGGWHYENTPQNLIGEASTKQANIEQLQKELADAERVIVSSVPVAMLPKTLQGDGSREDALRLINGAASFIQRNDENVDASIQLLQTYIAGRGMQLNTGRKLAGDAESARLVIALKRCLMTLELYDGEINEDCSGIQPIVVRFQNQNGLRADGVLGARTWALMKQHLEQRLRR